MQISHLQLDHPVEYFGPALPYQSSPPYIKFIPYEERQHKLNY